MYGIAEARYFAQSHEDKWKRVTANAGQNPFRVYGKMGLRMASADKAAEAKSGLQGYVDNLFTSTEGGGLDFWGTFGVGKISMHTEGEMFKIGACVMQSEKLILDALQIKSLSELSGYKELWTLMSDIQQSLTM
jgi:hypothetical protein